MSAADVLARAALFHSLNENVRREIAQRLVRVEAAFDSVIASAGEPPDALYLVENGAIGMFVAEGHVQELSAQLGPGESFGEVEIVTGRPRAVSYGAIEDSVLYRLERDAFRALAAQHPTIVSITLRVLAERLQRLSGAPTVPWVSLAGRQLDRRLWALAPEALFFQHGVAPLELQGRLLTVAMSNPRDTAARTALARSVPNVALKIVATSEVELKRFIEAGGARRQLTDTSKETRPKITFIEDEPAAHTKGSATGQQIVELVEEIVATGLSIGASDIHVDSERRGVAVRYRVDGTLRPRPRLLPLDVARPLVSRFKLL
jgi:CRP-like cAMP-binding protein